MEEKSLKIVGADKNFFGKLTNTLTKIIMPTRIGLNSIIISIKRNAMLKAYFNLIELEESSEKTEAISKKYDAAYATYLEAIDKYIMDSIYKKVKNKTATKYEEDALSKYYNVTSLKDTQYAEYKYRKQKYLIELDYSGLEASKKDKVFAKYKIFYYKTVEGLYKGILKNYSVQIANTVNSTPSAKEAIYKKIEEGISTSENCSHFNSNILKLLSNENKSEEFLKVSFKNFADKKVRQKFIDVGEKDLYDTYYDYDTCFSHGYWGAIRESSLLFCDNAAHNYHSVPDVECQQKLICCYSDLCFLLDKIIKIMNEELGVE